MSATAVIPDSQGADLADDFDIIHVVCHCTNDEIAWCGLPGIGEWVEGTEDERECPLCGLVEDESNASCPFGCNCDECGA